MQMQPEEFMRRLIAGDERGQPDGASTLRALGVEHDEWTVDWGAVTQRRRSALLRRLPTWLAFDTSGHTGAPRRWHRHRTQLMAETALLDRHLHGSHADVVLTFAPPHHLYGFLAGFLLPLWKGIPVQHRSIESFEPPPIRPGARVMVVAVPAALHLLLRQAHHLLTAGSVTIVHSTASLPAAGPELVERLRGRARLVELFGSTETGLVATREVEAGVRPAWRLAPDVAFSGPIEPGAEVTLTITSPRLARPDGDAASPLTWQLDDQVRTVADREFVFEGRRSRLVKVNGRRLDLEELEDRLRSLVPNRDLACTPVIDQIRGESFDLLLVPLTGTSPLSVPVVRRALQGVVGPGRGPRRIRIVPRIDRTATGKLRELGPHRRPAPVSGVSR